MLISNLANLFTLGTKHMEAACLLVIDRVIPRICKHLLQFQAVLIQFTIQYISKSLSHPCILYDSVCSPLLTTLRESH